jgi:hypothetical protein
MMMLAGVGYKQDYQNSTSILYRSVQLQTLNAIKLRENVLSNYFRPLFCLQKRGQIKRSDDRVS